MDRNGAEREPGHTALVFALGGAIARAEIPALCERLQALLEDGAGAGEAVTCDVGRLGRSDLVVLEALARLQLTARRHGHRLWLRGASHELHALLALTGLAEILPIEPWRQAEQRKQARGVEEEGDAGEPIA